MADFALIGAAGFVAPRHMRAIAETGNDLIAACDKSDSVGILDKHFPDAEFFTDLEPFGRYLKRHKVRYISIATPNYLHYDHIRFGLDLGAQVICEKPLVLNPESLPLLNDDGQRINAILQLRLHPAMMALKRRMEDESLGTMHEVVLDYITERGRWYFASWKNDPRQSGGLITNIGIHLFDLLLWLFGPTQSFTVSEKNPDRAVGELVTPKAHIRWLLSLRNDDLPNSKGDVCRYHRHMTIDGEPLDFSHGIDNLHTESYREILAGRGFHPQDCAPAIELTKAMQDA